MAPAGSEQGDKIQRAQPGLPTFAFTSVAPFAAGCLLVSYMSLAREFFTANLPRISGDRDILSASGRRLRARWLSRIINSDLWPEPQVTAWARVAAESGVVVGEG